MRRILIIIVAHFLNTHAVVSHNLFSALNYRETLLTQRFQQCNGVLQSLFFLRGVAGVNIQAVQQQHNAATVDIQSDLRTKEKNNISTN